MAFEDRYLHLPWHERPHYLEKTKSVLKRNVEYEEFDKNNVLLKTNNRIDIWIIMKILENEIDFLIEYYYDRLVEDNILPSPFLNIT